VASASGYKEANVALVGTIPRYDFSKIGDEEDFVFQLNEPRTIDELAGMRMNFITKWSVERFQMFVSPINLVGFAPTSTQSIKEFIVPSVSIDINSAPTGPLIAPRDRSVLLRSAIEGVYDRLRSSKIILHGV